MSKSKTLHDFEFLPSNMPLENLSQEWAYLLLNLKFNSKFWNDEQNWKKLWNLRIIKAVFGYRDNDLLSAARQIFAAAMVYMYGQFSETKDVTIPQLQDHLHHCICMLPYFEWQTGDTIQLPEFNDGHWELNQYYIERISLLPRSGFLSLWTGAYDECYAYALINENCSAGYFVFSGTTYPAGQGFRTHIQEDLKPFQTPGQTLFSNAIPQISAWLNRGPSHISVVGMSLGGAMALQMGMAFPERVNVVSAINPPGIEPFFAHPHDKWDNTKNISKPEVRIIIQGQDPVSCYGIFKPDWTMVHYQLTTQDAKNPFWDHVLTYTGEPNANYTILNIQTENDKRYWINIWIYTVLRAFVYGVVVLPWIFLINPIWNLIQEHFLTLLLTFVFIICHVLPGFLLPLAIAFLVVELLQLIFNLENSVTYCLIRDISNQSIYSQIITAGVLQVAIILVAINLSMFSSAVWISLPVLAVAMIVLNHAIQQVFGIHENLCDDDIISKKNQL